MQKGKGKKQEVMSPHFGLVPLYIFTVATETAAANQSAGQRFTQKSMETSGTNTGGGGGGHLVTLKPKTM